MAAQQDEAKTIGDLVAKLVAKLGKVGDRGKYVCALEVLERVALEHFDGNIGAAFKPTMDALASKTYAFIFNCNNATMVTCFRQGILAAPLYSLPAIQKAVRDGACIVLYNIDSKTYFYNITPLASPPGRDLKPGLFDGRFPAQLLVNFNGVESAMVHPKSHVKKFGPLNEDEQKQMLAALDKAQGSAWTKPKARASAREPKIPPKPEARGSDKSAQREPGLGKARGSGKSSPVVLDNNTDIETERWQRHLTMAPQENQDLGSLD